MTFETLQSPILTLLKPMNVLLTDIRRSKGSPLYGKTATYLSANQNIYALLCGKFPPWSNPRLVPNGISVLWGSLLTSTRTARTTSPTTKHHCEDSNKEELPSSTGRPMPAIMAALKKVRAWLKHMKNNSVSLSLRYRGCRSINMM